MHSILFVTCGRCELTLELDRLGLAKKAKRHSRIEINEKNVQ